MAWTDRFIGVPYTEANCVELIERVMREQFGKCYNFPKRVTREREQTNDQLSAGLPDYCERSATAVDGAPMLMRAGGRMHVGLYVEHEGQGYVLHSHTVFGGSVCQPLRLLPFPILGFYKWKT